MTIKKPTENERRCQRFWQQLDRHLEAAGSRLRITNPQPKYNYDILIVSGGAYIALTLVNKRQRNGVEIYLADPKYNRDFFNSLQEDKEAIEREFVLDLDWVGPPETAKTKIVHEDSFNPSDESDWQRQHIWFKDMIEKFDRVFTPRLESIAKDLGITRAIKNQ